jgi:hypothetical protein
MYSVTDVTIFNKALARIGESYMTVTAVDGTDTSKYGVLAGYEYQATRNEELRANDWLFAITRVQLTPDTSVAGQAALANTGFWYVYDVPADCLKPMMVYSVLPQFVTTYPFKHVHISPAPFVHETGYIFTDLDNTNDNPFLRYVKELPLGTAWTEPLFVDALALRLASKLAVAGARDEKGLTAALQGEYAYVLKRAREQNALDKEDDLPEQGQEWWTDRDRFSRS